MGTNRCVFATFRKAFWRQKSPREGLKTIVLTSPKRGVEPPDLTLSMLNRANLVGFWRLFVRRLTGVGSFLYQRFKRRTPHGKVGPTVLTAQRKTGSTHTGSTSVGGRWPAVWSTQSVCSCSTHQAHPCACPRGRGRKLVAIQTEARACQPRNCPFCHAAPRVGCTL